MQHRIWPKLRWLWPTKSVLLCLSWLKDVSMDLLATLFHQVSTRRVHYLKLERHLRGLGKDQPLPVMHNFSSSQCGVGCKMLDNAWGAEMPGKQTSSLTISWWSEASFNRANLLSTPAKICPNRNNLKMHSTIPSHGPSPNGETNTSTNCVWILPKLQNCACFERNCHFYIILGPYHQANANM